MSDSVLGVLVDRVTRESPDGHRVATLAVHGMTVDRLAFHVTLDGVGEPLLSAALERVARAVHALKGIP